MILTCKFDRVLKDDSQSIVSFKIPNYQAEYLINLDKTKEYKLELNEIKSKRSLQQNRLIWQMIGQIAKHEGMESMEVYCQIIKMAKIKIEFIETIPEAIPKLKNLFREVVEREVRCSAKGVTTVMLECYYGTSTFTVPEMSDFVDQMLDYAEKIGINTTEYER